MKVYCFQLILFEFQSKNDRSFKKINEIKLHNNLDYLFII